MKTAEIRAAFLRFFQEKSHSIEPSAPLIPIDDPSLLFTNAGMVPFKPFFLGEKKPPHSCVTSSQRCLRVGGKHNDLDNVGFTARHHTLFEMLGNFSFGAYDKEKAIEYAWEFLTKTLQLPEERLLVTVYKDDADAKKIWQDHIGVEADKIISCGEKDNFWSMGDTGPCGPCTEIFYDHGPEVAGGPPGSVDEDGDRFVEVWNLVFMEYDRQQDGTLLPLPHRCVDTGMGLERIAAVMQGVTNNFDTDSFTEIIQQAKALARDMPIFTQRILADHLRAICWLIAEQVRPSNEGRGYVLRRIIRRALRYAYSAGVPLPCLYLLVDAVVAQYSHDQRLQEEKSSIISVLRIEEEAFAQTIRHGMSLFHETVANLDSKMIPGAAVFKLYDTYGFPQDLVIDLAREQGLDVDIVGYEKAMAAQKARSRKNQKFIDKLAESWSLPEKTVFDGYKLSQTVAKIKGLFAEDLASEVKQLTVGKEGRVVLDHTPFYAESGGQVGDVGSLTTDDGVFTVLDTQKHEESIVHYGICEQGAFSLGQQVTACVDSKRDLTKKNHSATHLLHAALRAILGTHVTQKGSLVSPERLRFDFSHTKALTEKEKDAIEQLVNTHITANHPISTKIMDLESAKKKNILALFTEKYEQEVRVLTMGEFSQELCGGTHCSHTGDIGIFIIVQETAVAQGVRRIEALTGMTAFSYVQQKRRYLQQLAYKSGCAETALEEKFSQTQQRLKAAEKKLQAYQIEQQKSILQKQVKSQLVQTSRYPFSLVEIEQESSIDLRTSMDICMLEASDTIVCLYQAQATNRYALAIGVGQNIIDKVNARTLFQDAVKKLGARGGGKPQYAQGQIVVQENTPVAGEIKAWLCEYLSS